MPQMADRFDDGLEAGHGERRAMPGAHVGMRQRRFPPVIS